jgi:hypothetical protein
MLPQLEPARNRGDVGDDAAAAIAKAKDEMEQIKRERRIEHAEAGEQQRAHDGADNDHDARVDSVDQPAGENAADARADEIAGGRAARERHWKGAFAHESVEQNWQIIETQPRRGGEHQRDGADHVPAVENAVRHARGRSQQILPS